VSCAVAQLEAPLHGGLQQVRVVLRALALIHCHERASAPGMEGLVLYHHRQCEKLHTITGRVA
jgi:hypothetical protein